MNELDSINGAEVPGWPSIYVIGSYDSRITFYSQQVRGFNLASALVANGILQGKRRFAVIGAGAAGLSVSAGLSILKPDCHVDVFEREEQALHLQRGCLQRNLHPHIYEWPRQGAREGSAGLPFLNWSAGTADSVAAEVMRQFGTLQAHRPNALAIKVLREVTAIERIGTAAYRVRHQSDRGDDLLAASYDAVFIAIGFGRERQLGNAPWNSYWSDRGVPGAPRYADHDTTILISGAGDGGLIDLCAAALQDFDHTALIELVTTWPGIEEISEALLQIDLEAEQFGRGFDFLAAYGRFVGPRLRDDGLIGEIAGRLRNRVNIIFNTQRDELLVQPTSTLNRLLVYLLFSAAHDAGLPIRHLPGEISEDVARQGFYFVSGTELRVDELFIRHGAAKLEAFRPFEDIRAAYEANHVNWLAADSKRYSPPHLFPSAAQELDHGLATANVPVSRHLLAAAVQQQPQRVRIGLADRPPSIVWSGNIRPIDLLSWWENADRALNLECGARPTDLGSLAGAVARFVIHARQVRMETDDRSWNEWLTSLTQRSPHAHSLQSPIIGAAVAAQMQSAIINADVVAAELHAGMDIWTLNQVDEHLMTYLTTGSEAANWVTWRIEPILRSEMARRWIAWQIRLRADLALLGRLLRLAACTIEDDGDNTDRQVLVGPLRMANIIRTITLALATAEAWPNSFPRSVAPGNFDNRADDGTEISTIHASGADLIEGRSITLMATLHAWQTSFVLLSELNAPASFEQAGQLSLSDAGLGDMRMDAPPTPCNVIIGVDASFQRALGLGAHAVVNHIAATEARLRQQWQAQIDTGEVQA
jgi:hypothetical protein